MRFVRTWWWLLLPVLTAGLVDGLAVGRAPLWRDETATWQFASLGWNDLAHATDQGDRVLAPYYGVLHLITLVTHDLVALRLASVLAGVVAVGAVAMIGQRLWSAAAGCASGLALAVSGFFVGLSVEARPSVLASAGCAVATYVLVLAVQREQMRTADWVWFTVLSIGAVAMQPFVLLALPAQAALLIGKDRGRVLRFAVTAVPVVLVAGGLLAMSSGQRGQVSWIPMPSTTSVSDSMIKLVGGSLAVTVVLLALALALAGTLVGRTADPGLALAVGLVVLPVAGLVIGSHIVQPVFVPRYLTPVPLGVALLVGAGVHVLGERLADRRVLAVLVAAVVAVTAFGQLHELERSYRDPRADDFPTVIRYLNAHLSPDAVLVVHQPSPTNGTVAGLVAYADDPGWRRDHLAALGPGLAGFTWRRVLSTGPLRTTKAGPEDYPRELWLMTRVNSHGLIAGLTPLKKRGYRVTSTWQVDGDAVIRLEPKPGGFSRP